MKLGKVLSRTEGMWVARLRRGARVIDRPHLALRRLVNRGIVQLSVRELPKIGAVTVAELM